MQENSAGKGMGATAGEWDELRDVTQKRDDEKKDYQQHHITQRWVRTEPTRTL